MEEYVASCKIDYYLGDIKKDLDLSDINFTFGGYSIETIVEAETAGKALSKVEESFKLLIKWISLLFNSCITIEELYVTDSKGRKITRTKTLFPMKIEIEMDNYDDIVISKLESLKRRSKMIIYPDNYLIFALDSIVLGNKIRALKGLDTTRYAILEYYRAIEKMMGGYCRENQIEEKLKKKGLSDFTERVTSAFKIRSDYDVAHAYRNKSADSKDADSVRDVAKDILLKLSERDKSNNELT